MANLDVTTTNGEVFTEQDSAELAYLVWRRWGKDDEAAAAAWRRLHQNSCPTSQFVALVKKGGCYAR